MVKKNILTPVLKKYSKVTTGDASFGIAAKNLSTGKSFQYNEDAIFGIGSIIKIPIAIALFKLYEEGKIDIYKPISLNDFSFFDNKNRDSGILRSLPKDTEINLYLCCLLMISISDNFGTNIVLESVGQDFVNKYLGSLGFKDTKVLVPRIDSYLFNEAPHDLGESTASEMAEIMEGFMEGRFISEESSREILKFMSMESSQSKSLRYLPTGKNVFDEKLEIIENYSKSGVFPRIGSVADVSVIKTQKGEYIIFAVFTKKFEAKDRRWHRQTSVDHISSIFIGETCEVLYRFLS